MRARPPTARAGARLRAGAVRARRRRGPAARTSGGTSSPGSATSLLGPLGAGETLEDAARRLAAPLRLDALRRGSSSRSSTRASAVCVCVWGGARVSRRAARSWPPRRWVARDELDFAAMPADDAHWYERVLDGELLQARSRASWLGGITARTARRRGCGATPVLQRGLARAPLRVLTVGVDQVAPLQKRVAFRYHRGATSRCAHHSYVFMDYLIMPPSHRRRDGGTPKASIVR